MPEIGERRIIQETVDVEQYWGKCYSCGGSGKARKIIGEWTDRTSSMGTFAVFRQHEQTDDPCPRCNGVGALWESLDEW